MAEHQKKRDFFPKKEVKQQLDDLLKDKQPLHYEKDVPLTPQDITLIKQLFIKITLLLSVLSLPLVGVIYLFQEEEMVWVICGAFLFLFLVIIIRASYQVGSNLRSGKKTMVRGIVTDRFTKKEYRARDEDGQRSEKIVNYLQVGTREFAVNQLIYKSYKTGDAIELHFIVAHQNKPYFIHHSKLKDVGLRAGA